MPAKLPSMCMWQRIERKTVNKKTNHPGEEELEYNKRAKVPSFEYLKGQNKGEYQWTRRDKNDIT